MPQDNQWTARHTVGPNDKWVDLYGTTLRQACLSTDNQIYVVATDMFHVGDSLVIGTVHEGQKTLVISSIDGNLALISLTGNVGQAYSIGTPAIVPIPVAVSGAPSDATYITQTPNGSLSAEQALSALATGILKNTTGTGVLSAAAEGTDYYKPGGTDVAVADGGTGASTAAAARTNLGLGTIATQDASAVAITGGSVTGITDVAVADGGTGSSTASGARTNLGLGSIATQAASAVAITGGSVTGITDLAVADGGTGASDAATARTNLGLATVAATGSHADLSGVTANQHHNQSHDHSAAGDGTALAPASVAASGAIASGAKLSGVGPFVMTSIITAIVGANQNNYSPAGLSTCADIVITATGGTRTITGWDHTGFVEGQEFTVINDNNNSLVFAHGSTSSSSGNRIGCPGTVDMTVPANSSVTFRYLPNEFAANPFRVEQIAGATVFAAPALTLGTTNSAGAATTVLATDSTILAFDGTAPVTQAMGDAAAVGAAAVAARRDHVHGMPALGTTAAAIGTSAGGSATTPSKSDHVHATGAGTPSTQALGDAAATGTGPAAAMTDHKHAMPAAAVTSSGLTASATSRVVGRITAGSGALEELTAANLKTILALAQADISGLTTASSPQFTGIELGNASDTTLTRLGAGRMAVEGREVIAWDGVITKVTTESVASSTVLQDDDELFIALTSGKVYWIELFIIYDSPAGGATPDLKVVVGEDATARGVFVADRLAAADAASSGVVAADQTTTSACGTATTPRVCKMHGWYVSNGGTFKMQWAQITSGANATRVLAGSFLRYRLVA